MFDKAFIKYDRSNGNVYERREIHEHRAPTDESVRLLNEIQEKAKKNLLASVKIENNVFKCFITVFQPDHLTRCHTFLAKFYLNEKEYIIEERIPDFDTYKNPAEEIMKRVFKKVADETTVKLINNFAKTDDFSYLCYLINERKEDNN